MLTQLYIENVAVIRKASIRLGDGFNVFTGETGAGKTILISAIDAVLGERTSRDIIRAGEERAFISALFEDLSPEVAEKLRELGYQDDEGSLLITREITAAGKTSCKIGGMPATVSILREVASLLIHIHGQRDSQQLLLPERHLEMIDAYGELSAELSDYSKAYEEMRRIRTELDSIQLDDAQKAQRIDLLTFQIGEIEDAHLEDEAEEENLMERRGVIRNSEKILDGLSTAYMALSGDNEREGMISLLDQLQDGISSAAEHVSQFETMGERLTEIGYELEEYSGDIHDFLEEFEFDPQEINDIEYRLDTIYKLKRKYGNSIAEILSYADRARTELEAISTSEERAQQLQIALETAEKQATAFAKQLSQKRTAAAQEFIAQVEKELAFLDMPSVRLSVAHAETSLSASGMDQMEFLIVTNVGEQPKPLSKIASGGEIARIMLAIKNVLADRDHIPTLIFDEVDTGVSGRAAQKIGHKLRQVSRVRQVICVTHLAQVAAFANTHLYIHKEVEDGRTYTYIDELDEDGAVAELARITSGDHITEIALQNARELRKSSQDSQKE